MSCNCKDENMVLKIKLMNLDAFIPTQAHPNEDAGYDVYACADGVDVYNTEGGRRTYLYTEYDTGISIEPPVGYHVELYPRSSITKVDLILKNSIGLIDNGYRGNLIFRFHKLQDVDTKNVYKKGDRIGQMVLRKTIHMPLQVVNSLSLSSRGDGGYGSSGQ